MFFVLKIIHFAIKIQFEKTKNNTFERKTYQMVDFFHKICYSYNNKYNYAQRIYIFI